MYLKDKIIKYFFRLSLKAKTFVIFTCFLLVLFIVNFVALKIQLPARKADVNNVAGILLSSPIEIKSDYSTGMNSAGQWNRIIEFTGLRKSDIVDLFISKGWKEADESNKREGKIVLYNIDNKMYVYIQEIDGVLKVKILSY